MSAVDDAIHQLRRHRGLVRVGEPTAEGEFIAIEVDVAVELPGRARAAQISSTGVRAIEPCLLMFAEGWPVSAPRVLLRSDFPLDFPHINPHVPGQRVSPCLFDGSLDELLHRFGLDALIDQLVEWLHKAAGGTLIDLAQGWEPMRRDSCPSTIVFSAEQAVASTPSDGSVLVTSAVYFTVPALNGIHATLQRQLASQVVPTFEQVVFKTHIGEMARGKAGAFLVRAPGVFSSYQPDSVVDLETLLSLVASFGIDRNALRGAIDAYYRRSVLGVEQDPRSWSHGLFAIVILLVERPVALIGSPNRKVEMLPYVIRFSIAKESPLEQNASVQPASHAHALSPQLLATTSGVAVPQQSSSIVMWGCGSLGSKIALHLGRSGIGRMTFVDKEFMSPHNAARHALVTGNDPFVGNKADLMKNAFEELSHVDCRAVHDDVVDLLRDPARFAQIVPDDVRLVVDATASLKVLAAETLPNPLDRSRTRLLRVVLFGQGRCAVSLLEGEGRACRVDDLTARVFEWCRFDTALRAQIVGESSELSRVFVGDNCRSLTARMSDARLSRGSATIALQLERWLTSELPRHGQIGLGVTDAENMGMSWQREELGPTTALEVREEGGWQVRLLHPVAHALDQDARRWSPNETGGALVGRVSYTNRTITIAGTVDAPPDSVRGPARFILGTDGLVRALRQAHADSLGYLSFVGTWHSHPVGGRHSGIDRRTLSRIAEDASGMPAISLIWTPAGFACAVEQW